MTLLKDIAGVGSCFNQKLLLTVAVLAVSQFNFGMENRAFDAIQAMDYFIQHFGETGPNGKKIIKSTWLSLFNGFGVVGFAVGTCLCSSPRNAMLN